MRARSLPRCLGVVAALARLGVTLAITSLRLASSKLLLRFKAWRSRRRLKRLLIRAGLPRELAEEIASDYAERMRRLRRLLSIASITRLLREHG